MHGSRGDASSMIRLFFGATPEGVDIWPVLQSDLQGVELAATQRQPHREPDRLFKLYKADNPAEVSCQRQRPPNAIPLEIATGQPQ